MAKSIVKKQETGLANWDAELAKYAQEASDKEQVPTGNFISFKAGQLSIAGAPVPGNSADVLLLHSIYLNKYYDKPYDPDEPAPPCCYAFSDTEEGLKPHENVKEPMHEQCKGCPMNAWKSAKRDGKPAKGKACRNSRRIALISMQNVTKPEQIKDSEVFMAEPPPTSIKAWASYVKGLNSVLKRPIWAVITKLSVMPDPKTQFKVVFSEPRPIPKELGPAIMAKIEEVKATMEAPYPEPTEPEAAPTGKTKKAKF